jgi:hypothetical protein
VSRGELEAWAAELRAIAAAMEAANTEEGSPIEAAKQTDIIPGWILEATDL